VSKTRRAVAYEAKLRMNPGIDHRAPGGAVTAALCGHWEHDGTCRWPHNSEIRTTTDPAIFRVIVVADEVDQSDVIARIESALSKSPDWSVEGGALREVEEGEASLAGRLINGPRALPTDEETDGVD
jgi:hypothetical protein